MTTEQYSIGYDEGYQAGWNEAMEANPAQQQEPGRSCNDAYELIMKWADIYAAQTGRIYSEAAQDPTKTAKMADERTMLACAVAQALSQPAQQEPMAVARVDDLERGGRVRALAMGLSLDAPLYTSPPASKPLTDEEIYKIANDLFYGNGPCDTLAMCRAIEAAHGIKEDA